MAFHANHRKAHTDQAWIDGGAPIPGTIQNGSLNETSRRVFLDAMRQVATSVTIVPTEGPAGRHGATVSAIASVSADPPTVLVCLRSSSRIGLAVPINRNFTVNVLPEGAHDVARVFAGTLDTTSGDRFDEIRLEPMPGYAAGIQGASYVACSVIRSIVQHTHTIVVGHVANVATVRWPPLVYHEAGYGRVRREEVVEHHNRQAGSKAKVASGCADKRSPD